MSPRKPSSFRRQAITLPAAAITSPPACHHRAGRSHHQDCVRFTMPAVLVKRTETYLT
jgi:hypothetical protein